mgnify:CR=1 FL=1
MAKLKVAIVGGGFIANRNPRPMLALPDGAEVVVKSERGHTVTRNLEAFCQPAASRQLVQQ